VPATAESVPFAPQPLRGVLLVAGALLLFAGMDTTTKYLATAYNVPLVVAVRFIVHLVLMLAILGPSQGRRLVETRRTGLVLLRAACLVGASLCAALAFRRMPVAETTAIVFLSPMLVVVAAPLLGERSGPLGWAAAVGGFVGVLMIARPGAGLETTGVLCALGAATLTTLYQLLSRLLAGSERTIPLLFHVALVGSVSFGILLPWTLHGPPPTALQVALFLGIGVVGGLGHFLFTAAYRHASASVLAPIGYLQLLWAGLLGWLVFGHVPDRVSVLGMAVVVGAGVLIALQSRR
jgi:drug/metabolite transporter (DMT)-like permease